MPNILKNSGKACSVPKGMAIAAAASMILTMIFSAIIANSLHKEKITWQQAGYWIMGMLFLVSFIGGKSAYAVIKRQRFIIAVMSGFLYWGMLLCVTVLFFGGDYSAVLETAGIIMAGCCTSAILCLPGPQNSRKKRGGKVVKLNKNFK